MARQICKYLGVLLLAAGLLGFLMPGMMGMHLSAAHNLVHIVSGALAAFYGFKGNYNAAKNFCLIFGVVYGLLGIVGLLSGSGTPTMHGMGPTDHLLTIIPGQLEFGTADSIIHVVVGALFLFGGLTKTRVQDMKAADVGQAMKEKVGLK